MLQHILKNISDWWLYAAVLLAVMDIFAFALYGIDKRKACRKAWRIPEKVLLASALPGGIGAYLGMRCFRHKTRKWYFRVWVGLWAAIQFALALAGAVYMNQVK